MNTTDRILEIIKRDSLTGSRKDDARIIGIANNPEFEKAERVHDWRNHVMHDLRPIWGELSLETRLAVMALAFRDADYEDWD